MTIINTYNRNQWLGMKALKSSIDFMRRNNATDADTGQGIYDNAISKQNKVFKYFLGGDEYREELPSVEDSAANAA